MIVQRLENMRRHNNLQPLSISQPPSQPTPPNNLPLPLNNPFLYPSTVLPSTSGSFVLPSSTGTTKNSSFVLSSPGTSNKRVLSSSKVSNNSIPFDSSNKPSISSLPSRSFSSSVNSFPSNKLSANSLQSGSSNKPSISLLPSGSSNKTSTSSLTSGSSSKPSISLLPSGSSNKTSTSSLPSGSFPPSVSSFPSNQSSTGAVASPNKPLSTGEPDGSLPTSSNHIVIGSARPSLKRRKRQQQQQRPNDPPPTRQSYTLPPEKNASPDDDEDSPGPRIFHLPLFDMFFAYCNRETRWKRNRDIEFDLPVRGDLFTTPESLQPPLDYFSKFVDSAVLDLIVRGTNAYSKHKSGHSLDTCREEISKFIGILLFMGFEHTSSYTDYWRVGHSQINERVMKLGRFQQLLRYLYFTTEVPVQNHLMEIYYLMRRIRYNFLTRIEDESTYIMDDLIIPFKGEHADQVRAWGYNKCYVKKYGFKFFLRMGGQSGIVYDFLLQFGKYGRNTFDDYDLTPEEKKLKHYDKVVLVLSKSIASNHSVAIFNNWYLTSLELATELKKRCNILYLGTICESDCQHASLTSRKRMLQESQGKKGCMDYVYDEEEKLVLVKWLGMRGTVTLVSNYVGVLPLATVTQKNVQEQEFEMECPQIIKVYYDYKEMIDRAHKQILQYRTPLSSKHWYLRIFSKLLDICVVNAWCLYKREAGLLGKGDDEVLDLKAFRMVVAKELMMMDENVFSPPPAKKVAREGDAHFPVHAEKKRRCSFCKTGQTVISCNECEVGLCLNSKRNCFMDYHVSLPS